jgi:protein-tyrosine-phosphatase
MDQAPETSVKILFVCVGNSCRSQMAEAWANHFGKGRVQAASAGSHPLGEITKDTYTVMSEKGISLDGQWSKRLRDVPVAEMDVVVGMGCEVECPLPEGFKGRVVEWNVPDPYGRGIEAFRNVRDMIERQVLGLLADLLVPDVPDVPACPDAGG